MTKFLLSSKFWITCFVCDCLCQAFHFHLKEEQYVTRTPAVIPQEHDGQRILVRCTELKYVFYVRVVLCLQSNFVPASIQHLTTQYLRSISVFQLMFLK